ncbi:MAG: YcgN family cysteine cluster protein [Gammaproteobacteria bacterium]|nr:YcgN family cysteine cluster protein [Gammaproteobacteria bacterium]
MVTEAPQFWNTKLLVDMTQDEWESLCDGCGRCCLHKLEDIDTDLVFYTNVICHLFDERDCRCSDYPHRAQKVKDCLLLNPANESQFKWLPTSCAYRRLAEGKPLEWWHPLLTGSQETVRAAGVSVQGRTICETKVTSDQLENHIISWIDF